jgi:hypothetical protein
MKAPTARIVVKLVDLDEDRSQYGYSGVNP